MKLALGTTMTAPKFKLGGRERALIGIAIAALLGLLWYFYLYSPGKLTAQTLRDENAQLETDITIGRAARASLPQLRASIAKLKEQRDSFLALLPEENEVAQLLDQLRSAARTANVNFSGITNGGPPAEVVPGVRQLNFNLATEGSYGRTISFLRALEALPRFTRVQSVMLGTGAAGEEASTADPSLGAGYDFTVYVYTGIDPDAVDPTTGEPITSDPNATDPNAVAPETGTP